MDNRQLITKLIKIFVFLSGIVLISVYEEPRISLLLELIFPGDFPKIFSYSLPGLVVAISVFSNESKLHNWKIVGSVLVFTLILILSYTNTVLTSIQDSIKERSAKIEKLQDRIDKKQEKLEKLKNPRTCYAPSKNTEDYETKYESYRICLLTAKSESNTLQSKSDSLSKSILILNNRLSNLENSKPDYLKAFLQGSTGFFLTILLSISMSVFTYQLSKDLREFILFLEFDENSRIALLMLQKKSSRDIAKELNQKHTTTWRKMKKISEKHPWNTFETPLKQFETPRNGHKILNEGV